MGDKVKWLAVAAAASVLGGCYPLEQAPLVYSSKQQIGVHVTAGTTDTPGLDIVIGYKGLDIAMVPVAVAKYCDPKSTVDCESSNYQLKVISGGREERSDNGDLETSITSQRSAIKDAENRRDSNLIEIAEIDRNLDRFNQRTSLNNRLKEIRAQLSLAPADETMLVGDLVRERDEKTETLKAFDDVKDLDQQATQKRRKEITAKNEKIDAELISARSELAVLLEQMRTETAGNRIDALSVYGTFSGSAEGRSNEAKLNAGKVFATGVAAQYVAETAGVANCLASVVTVAEKITDTAKRDALISQVRDLCIIKHDGS